MAYELESDEAEISMDPLIDCVFLLLIFFLVGTMSKKEDKNIEEIQLPQSSSAESHLPRDDQAVIAISKNGAVFYDGISKDLMTLHRILRDLSLKQPNLQVRIDADKQAPLFQVVKVLDMCEFNQVKNLVLRSYDENTK